MYFALANIFWSLSFMPLFLVFHHLSLMIKRWFLSPWHVDEADKYQIWGGVGGSHDYPEQRTADSQKSLVLTQVG
jgi:hypothetical protein